MMKKLALIAMVAACGGVDDPNQCPTDDCTLYAHTTVKWTFNAYPERGFPMDACHDFGAASVAVDVVDADGFATSTQDQCGNGQVVLSNLAPGDYTVYVTPLDADGNALTSAPATGKVTAADSNQEVTVNVPWDAWLGTYTGTFLFRISWGGMSCETTDVRQQRLTLKVNGAVQAITTDDGELLNGSDMKPCKKFSDNFPQSALGANFGFATLLVEGFDVNSAMKYSKQFDTFVGAGITNPTLTFNVPLQ